MAQQNLLFSFEELALFTNGKWKNINTLNSKTIKSVITDTRQNCSDSIFIALEGENFDGHSFLSNAVDNGASCLCVNKKKIKNTTIPDKIPILLVDNTLKAYQNLATSHRMKLKNTIIIALTGSNGKTSTKDILYSILRNEFGSEKIYATKANTNNHIGVPLNLLNLNPKHKFAIIEMGSNHPGEISILTRVTKPDIAVITSIGPSHLEFFKNLNGVAKEKSCIFSDFNKNKENFAIIPFLCPEYKVLTSNISKGVKTITFGENQDSDIKIYDYRTINFSKSRFNISWKIENISYKVISNLPGKHQALNCAAASAVADVIGIPKENITKHLSNISITGMRMKHEVHNGVQWINDAYNANPSSVKAGIDYIAEIEKNHKIENKIFVVLGNMLELGKNEIHEHISVLNHSLKLPEKAEILCTGNLINKASKKIVSNRIKPFSLKHELIRYLEKNLKEGDLVYLKGSRGAKLEEIEEELKTP